MTSNLIAFWGLQEKERELGETLRHNLETEALNRRKLAIDQALGEMNANIARINALENARHNQASERLAQIQNNIREREVAITALRTQNDYELGLANVAQKERERVTDSYLQQKKLAQESRLKTEELGIKSTGNTIQLGLGTANVVADALKFALGYGVGSKSKGSKTTTNIGKMIIGGLALNVVKEAQ